MTEKKVFNLVMILFALITFFAIIKKLLEASYQNLYIHLLFLLTALAMIYVANRDSQS